VLCDDIRRGESLPRTGDAEKGLVPQTLLETRDQALDSLGLIPRRLKSVIDLEEAHLGLYYNVF
jgi:hypothetical protein